MNATCGYRHATLRHRWICVRPADHSPGNHGFQAADYEPAPEDDPHTNPDWLELAP